jgi:hypothetical protein
MRGRAARGRFGRKAGNWLGSALSAQIERILQARRALPANQTTISLWFPGIGFTGTMPKPLRLGGIFSIPAFKQKGH